MTIFFYSVNIIDFVISGVAGTEDFSLENLAIWPNPTQGNVSVSFVSVDEKVVIDLFDIRGRKVATQTFTSQSGAVFNETLNYEGLQSGMYFVKISNGNASGTKRIIKR